MHSSRQCAYGCCRRMCTALCALTTVGGVTMAVININRFNAGLYMALVAVVILMLCVALEAMSPQEKLPVRKYAYTSTVVGQSAPCDV